MKCVKADLHVHTVLSPCGDLAMSPRNIIESAAAINLAILGITDHNSTRQISIIEDLAATKGIFVLGGVEITTREEVHCLAFFRDRETRQGFQRFIDSHQPFVHNDTAAFGYQVVADQEDNIVEWEEKLLLTALTAGIDDIEKEVHRMDGIFIPAHIDRPVNSVFSQLGFIPPRLQYEALEITCYTTANAAKKRFGLRGDVTLIKNSDAHFPQDIGKGQSLFTLEACTFDEIRLALAGKEGRTAVPFEFG